MSDYKELRELDWSEHREESLPRAGKDHLSDELAEGLLPSTQNDEEVGGASTSTASSDATSSNNNNKKKKFYCQNIRLSGGTLVLAVVAVAMIIGGSAFTTFYLTHRSSGGDSSNNVERDNDATSDLYQRMHSQIQNTNTNNFVINHELINFRLTQWMQSTLDATSLNISQAKLSLINNGGSSSTLVQTQGRAEIQVQGTGMFLGHYAKVLSSFHFYDGDLRLYIQASPIPLSTTADNNNGLPSDTNFLKLSELLPDGSIPTSYSDVFLQNVQFLASSHDTSTAGGTTVPAGLSVSANLDLGNQYNAFSAPVAPTSPDTPLPPNAGKDPAIPGPGRLVVYLMHQFYQQLENRANYTEGALLQVLGSLRPTLFVNITSLLGQNINIQDTVSIQNITATLCPVDRRANFSAMVIITPPGNEALTVALNGTADIRQQIVTVNGRETAPWSVPGLIQGMVLQQASASVVITYHTDTTMNSTTNSTSSHLTLNMTGVVNAQLNYGALACSVQMPLPPSLKSANTPFVFVAALNSTFALNQLPVLAQVADQFPQVQALQAAFLFASAAGPYNLPQGWSFNGQTQINVVAGTTLLVHVDVTKSNAMQVLTQLRDNSNSNNNLTDILLSGQLQSATGDFSLAATITNWVVDRFVNFNLLNVTLSSQPIPFTGFPNLGPTNNPPPNPAPKSDYISLAADLIVSAPLLSANNLLHFDVRGIVNDIGFKFLGNYHLLPLSGSSSPLNSISLAGQSFVVHDISVAFARYRNQPVNSPANTTITYTTVGLLSGYMDVDHTALYFGIQHPWLAATCGAIQLELDRLPPSNNSSSSNNNNNNNNGGHTFDHLIDLFVTDRERNLDVHDDVLNDILSTRLQEIDFFFSPGCGNISIAAQFNSSIFELSQVGLLIHPMNTNQNRNASNNSWQYTIYIQTAEDWNINKLITAQGLPPLLMDLQLTSFSILLASNNDTVTIPITLNLPQTDPALASLTTNLSPVAGLNVHAVFLAENNNRNLSTAGWFIHHLDPHAETIDFDGVFTATNFSLAADLTSGTGYDQGIDLGSHVILNSAAIALQLSSQGQSSLDLSSTLYVPNVFSPTDNLAFSVLGDLRDTQISLQGDMRDANTSIAIPFGSELAIEDVSARAQVVWGTAQPIVAPNVSSHTNTTVTGSIIGHIYIGESHRGHIDVELDILPHAVVQFNGTMSENPPFTFGDLVTTICGRDIFSSMSLPSSLHDKIENLWAFESLSLQFVSSPPTITASGAMELFGLSDLRTTVHLKKNNNAANSSVPTDPWSFALGVAIDVGASAANFSTILPSVRSLDSYHFFTMAVAVANQADTLMFPGIQQAYAVQPGFNFIAMLALNNSGIRALETVARWTGVDDVIVWGVVQNEDSFNLHADLQGNLDIFHFISITAAGLIVTVSPNNAGIGVESSVVIHLSTLTHNPTDELYFSGDFIVTVQGLQLDAAMTQDWVNPLGIHGLRFSRCALSLGITWEIVPYLVGLAGGVHIGEVGGDGAVYLSENQQLLYGSVQQINLQQIVDALLADFGVTSPPNLVQVITNLSLQQLSFYANPGATAIFFNQQNYPPGFMFSIQQLNLWGIIQGNGSLAIRNSGFTLNGQLRPINLLDGVLIISGAYSTSDPVSLFLDINTAMTTVPTLNMSGAVDLLGERVAVAAALSNTVLALYMDMNIFNSLFHFTLNCYSIGTASLPSDFSVNATLNNEVQDYIENQIPIRVNQTNTDLQQHVQGAMQDLQTKQSHLSSIEDQIDQIRQQDQANLQPAEQRLADAQAALNSAQNKVDSLQSQIDDFRNKISGLKWYEKWKAIGYGLAIAGLETAKLTADGALDAARLAVDAAQAAVDHASALDPRIVALETEHGIAEAALAAAQEILRGFQSTADGMSDLIIDIAHWQGQMFNVEEASISGSLKAIKQGDLAQMHIKGVFVGHSVDFTVDIDVSLIESMVESIWKQLLDLFTHRHLAAAAAAASTTPSPAAPLPLPLPH